MKFDNLSTDLKRRERVPKFVQQYADRNENEKRDFTRESAINCGQRVIGKRAPILRQRPQRADTEKSVDQ
jgi:hypothetical protein